jgi:hypothetical protein
VLEILLFEVHLLDRLIFGALGPFKRKVFVDAVFEQLGRAAQPMGLTVDALMDRVNKSQQEYAKYKRFYGEKGESLQGTLCWEFGKRLTFRYGVTNPAAPIWVTGRAMNLMNSLAGVVKHLEIDRLR